MIQPIVHDPLFLAQKSARATPADADTARDLLETLTAHADGCVGMAANMIGVAQTHHRRGSRGRVSGAVQPGHPQKVRPLQHRGGLSFAGGCAPHQALEKHQGAVRNCRRQAAHPHLYRLDGPDHPARDRPLRRHPDLMPPCNLRAKGVKYSHEPNTGELVMQAERKESTFDPLT